MNKFTARDAIVSLASAGMIIGTSSLAGTVPPLNTFQAGDPIVAAQVNDNFQLLRDAVNDDASRLGRFDPVTFFLRVPVDCGADPNALQDAVRNIVPGTGGFDFEVTGACGPTEILHVQGVGIFGADTSAKISGSLAEDAVLSIGDAVAVFVKDLSIENLGTGPALAMDRFFSGDFEFVDVMSSGGVAVQIESTSSVSLYNSTVSAGTGESAIRVSGSANIYLENMTLSTAGSAALDVFRSAPIELQNAMLNLTVDSGFAAISLGESSMGMNETSVMYFGGSNETTVSLHGSSLSACGVNLPAPPGASPPSFTTSLNLYLNSTATVGNYCGGQNNMLGDIAAGNGSRVQLQGSESGSGGQTTMLGNLYLNGHSHAELFETTAAAGAQVDLQDGSGLTAFGMDLPGSLFVGNGGTAQVNDSTIADSVLLQGGRLDLFDSAIGDSGPGSGDGLFANASSFIAGSSTINGDISVKHGAQAHVRDSTLVAGFLSIELNSSLELLNGATVGETLFVGHASSAEIRAEGGQVPQVFNGSSQEFAVFVTANSSLYYADASPAAGETFGCSASGFANDFSVGSDLCASQVKSARYGARQGPAARWPARPQTDWRALQVPAPPRAGPSERHPRRGG